MIENLPAYISVVFSLTVFATFVLFRLALKLSNTRKTNLIMLALIAWLIIQAILSANYFYTVTSILPPRFLLLIGPPLLTILILFLTVKGKTFIDNLPLINLTYINVVRVPVELVLYWLFLNGAVPELMTFSGRNFDILAGLTAPVIAYIGLSQQKFRRRTLLIWNIIALGLLLNIVINAILSAPSPFQKFAFDQPNIAILHFPFAWLPGFIVPVVLFGHLVSIRQLIKPRIT